MDWVEKELKNAQLGDKRLNRRLVKIVEDLGAQPEASVPQASRDNVAMQGIYEFWANRRIEPEEILESHVASTVERMEEHQVVLAIQDTTELDFSTHRSTRHLGSLSHAESRGLKVHTVLACSETGVPLGVLQQQVWAREKVRGGKGVTERRRAIIQKESYRWLQSLEITQTLVPQSVKVVTIGDREADIFELFAMPRRPGSELLIRAAQNRVVKNHRNEERLLFEEVRKVPKTGEIKIELQRTPRRKARRATLTIRHSQVALQPPLSHPFRQELSEIVVSAIVAEEESPPTGETAVSWVLLTTLEVEDFFQACRCLKLYAKRWLIERYHYVLKSGCHLEELQLEEAERLERALATYAIVAWRLLWLTYEARLNPEWSAAIVLSEEEWRILYYRTQKKKDLPLQVPKLRECVRWIGQLGGFLGRKGDGEPGVKTLWRGWTRLSDLVWMWREMKQIWSAEE